MLILILSETNDYVCIFTIIIHVKDDDNLKLAGKGILFFIHIGMNLFPVFSILIH